MLQSGDVVLTMDTARAREETDELEGMDNYPWRKSKSPQTAVHSFGQACQA